MTEDGWEGVAAAAAVGTAPAARCPPVGIESGFTEGNKKQTCGWGHMGEWRDMPFCVVSVSVRPQGISAEIPKTSSGALLPRFMSKCIISSPKGLLSAKNA